MLQQKRILTKNNASAPFRRIFTVILRTKPTENMAGLQSLLCQWRNKTHPRLNAKPEPTAFAGERG
ncbi:hypothetical protein SMZ27_001185 [Cronobacter sakazakii]|nr:hypothetical protein [Cronobacter sakazakii]EJG0745781.1 hypothetical protein [Cronobacter sakazakii]ELY2534425.1 hypothetical protein [Cronobacter sakazakii]ELY2537206.1 hypothetical protein [Cronobacter sakazakii]ELY2624137.1 hypothetical protein [Cronobacter sakazakii]